MIRFLYNLYAYRRAPRSNLVAVDMVANTNRMIAQFHANRSN